MGSHNDLDGIKLGSEITNGNLKQTFIKQYEYK